MADYWIKFYIEILDDPKMATMPDRLWRRTCELFLAAGKYGKAGLLPDTRQIAWMLRIPPDELEMDLKQIALTGIIERVGDGWLVKKFEQRQAPVSINDRVKAYRERQHKQQYYGDVNGDVTEMKRNVTQINRLTDNRLTDVDETKRDNNSPEMKSGEFAPLAEAFTQASNIPPFMPNPAAYSDALEKLFKAGVEPVDVTSAVKTLRGKNYTIVGPQSIINAAISEMGKRKSNGNGSGKKRRDY